MALRIARLFGALTLSALVAAPALAGEDEAADEPSILDHLPAFAPLKEARDALAEKGVRVSGFYFSDPRAGLSGGRDSGATYSGLFNLAVDLDGEKLFGVEGAKLHANMFQIHGKDVSERFVGNFLSANDIGARPSTRLFELWWQQPLNDQLEIRVGQMATDVEFITSDYGENFLDATFGWAGPPSENLPAGGPAYPLAAPGVRLKYTPREDFTLLAGLFNGYPAGKGEGDAEKRNRHGLNFEIGDPPLVLVEGQYRWNGGEEASGLPGTLKLGGYWHGGRFKRLDEDSRTRRGDFNLYAVLDQQVLRFGERDDERGLGVFLRGIFGPSDRNPVDAYVDGGFAATGLFASRPHDVFGIAAAWASFSPGLLREAREANADLGLADRPHGFEGVIEATYRMEMVPGLTVQPSLQYVIHPGAGTLEPDEDGARRVKNATIFGVATIVRF
ncbi:carbohydrate porin [Hansschlegelia quercus]|uniref:Carbohydrate porin n=1 Tax=Hansschlegelia quercus TaxID=2528245 RepID=A0A4Q9GCZ8_9HYPH|nr:carbohydrate porin [Hansschlegelia quercus]TBN47941.1 carbohydrate porin [Hansschlegelia quercus]